MKVAEFIDRLAEQGLLDAQVVGDLRRRVTKIQRTRKITPDMIAKFLVDRGHLTTFQATKLVNEANASITKGKTSKGGPDADELQLAPEADEAASIKRPAEKPAEKKRAAKPEDLELDDLIAIDDDSQAISKKPQKQHSKKPRVEPVEEPVTPAPVAPEPVPPPPLSPPVAKKKRKKREPEPEPEPEKIIELVEAPADQIDAELEETSPLLPDQRKRSRMSRMVGVFRSENRTGDVVRRRTGSDNPWDSKLLLVGGATLGLLVIGLTILVLSLTRGSADEMFSAAEQDYRDASYTQAIKRYDRYLKSYPADRNASLARVRRQMARLRQVYDNPHQGLEVAQEVLPIIETEEDFAEARDGLAAILPEIAEGLVQEAKEASDTVKQQELLTLCEQAMELVDNPVYLPTSLRKSQLARIDAITADMARVQREIDREANLVAAIEGISSAIENDDTQAAYDIRRDLLKKYPGLDTDKRLNEAVLVITSKQQEMVSQEDVELPILTTDRERTGKARVVLTHRKGAPTGGDIEDIVCVLAEGTVFALNAVDGTVLWSRYVGLETVSSPISVPDSNGGNGFLVTDAENNELVRVAGNDGSVMWRLQINEPFCDPVINGQHAYVATRSGKLLVIEKNSGKAVKQINLPQATDVGPAIDAENHVVYQLGEHDNIYALSSDTFECLEVFYVGHQAGTIDVPPTHVMGCLLIVENEGPDHSMLNVLGTSENGLELKVLQKPIRLRGRVVVPPVEQNRRVLIVTDCRAVGLYDVEPGSGNADPVRVAASLSATSEDPLTSYPLLADGDLWIANNRLAKYQVQASTGKLPRQWVKDERMICISPLQNIDGKVIQVYRHRDEPGVTVVATPIGGEEPAWQTEVAGEVLQVIVNDQQIHAMTANGRLFKVSTKELSEGIVTEGVSTAKRDHRDVMALSESIDLGDGRWVFSRSSEYDFVVLYDPLGLDGGLERVALAVPKADSDVAPVPFADGLLVPRRVGLVALISPKTGEEIARALHPEVAPGTSYRWNRPAVAQGGKQFAVSDKERGLFLVSVGQDPAPHLKASDQVTLENERVGPLAVFAGDVYGVVRSEGTDSVWTITPPDPKTVGQWELKGRLRFGPARLGDAVVVGTDLELACLDGGSEPRWRVTYENGPIVGAPLVRESDWVLCSGSGAVFRIDSKTGERLAKCDVGQPLASGPVAFGDQLIVATKNGTLVVLDELQQ